MLSKKRNVNRLNIVLKKPPISTLVLVRIFYAYPAYGMLFAIIDSSNFSAIAQSACDLGN